MCRNILTHNGVAERMNRTILNMVCSMTFFKNLKLMFWADAVLPASDLDHQRTRPSNSSDLVCVLALRNLFFPTKHKTQNPTRICKEKNEPYGSKLALPKKTKYLKKLAFAEKTKYFSQCFWFSEITLRCREKSIRMRKKKSFLSVSDLPRSHRVAGQRAYVEMKGIDPVKKKTK